MPGVASRQGGVSNFGNHLSTLGLYTLGFLGNIVFLYAAARLIAQRSGRRTSTASTGLRLLSAATLIVFLSTFPRFLGTAYYEAHDILGGVLYGYYFVISVWILLKTERLAAILDALVLIQAIGSILALLSALKVIHVLFIAQMIASFAFAGVLCIGLPIALGEQTINHS